MVQRKDLFEGTRPAKLGLDGETEMPILYYKDACAYFYFTADAEAVQKRLPSDNLHVVKVSPTRCMVALATYNYIHASVGSYGETVMVAICTQDKVPKGPLPLIRQARDAHFGTFVFRCPVTTQWAMDGGRIMWNYPKFISDMTFTSNGRYFECRLSSEGKRIFDLRAPKRGRLSRDTKPQRCFLAQGDKLVQAPIPAYGICERRRSARPASSRRVFAPMTVTGSSMTAATVSIMSSMAAWSTRCTPCTRRRSRSRVFDGSFCAYIPFLPARRPHVQTAQGAFVYIMLFLRDERVL